MIVQAIEIYRTSMYDTLVLYLAVFPENEVVRKNVRESNRKNFEQKTIAKNNKTILFHFFFSRMLIRDGNHGQFCHQTRFCHNGLFRMSRKCWILSQRRMLSEDFLQFLRFSINLGWKIH